MEVRSWIEAFTAEWSTIATQTVSYLPRLLLAIGMLVAGWLAAKLVRSVSIRLLLGLDRLWLRLISRRGLERLQPQFPPARIAGEILFWFVVLFSAAAAAAILGLDVFVSWLSAVATYIPILLTGLLIILAGVVISALMRDLTTTTAARTGIGKAELLGRLVQVMILIMATAIGVEQMGIDMSFLSVITGVALAATLGGAALAFGLGARSYMSNVIAGHQLRQLYQAGDRLRLRGFEGVIIELTPTKVILSTENNGRVIIPARLFEEEIAELQGRAGDENR